MRVLAGPSLFDPTSINITKTTIDDTQTRDTVTESHPIPKPTFCNDSIAAVLDSRLSENYHHARTATTRTAAA